MSTDHDPLTIRPPWADELPRVKAFLRDEPLGGRAWRLFTLVASAPERLVGVAALHAVGETGDLRFRLRPRIQQEGRGGEFLAAVLASARQQGLKRLCARTAPGSPPEQFLLAHGFELTKAEEVWRLDLAAVLARVERVCRAQAKLAWVIRAPVADDFAKFGRLADSSGPAVRLRLETAGKPGESDFDLELSTIIDSPGRLLAALMVRGGNGLNCRAALCAVARGAGGLPGRLAAPLIQRSVRAAIEQGYGTALCSLDPLHEVTARNLARRSGGELVSCARLLASEL